ncbi:MAG: metal-dependent hydrolase [Solirubrobacterales bacterium]|nr:metal-dependent hydrolase [Solirubrobacterales bacterium]
MRGASGSSPGRALLTWLGHGSFRLDSTEGVRIYVDPWLAGNPSCPEGEHDPERADVIVITHGHVDHVEDAIAVWEKHRPTVIAQLEVRHWLERQGVEPDMSLAPNKGGTVTASGVGFTYTDARHSSSTPDGAYAGEACGVVVELEHGATIYFAGDTCVFGDMTLIGRLYEPDLAVLPIGGHFTMDPTQAALALELLGVGRCVPCHYGTFPFLTGRPEQLSALARGVEVHALRPGETLEVAGGEWMPEEEEK